MNLNLIAFVAVRLLFQREAEKEILHYRGEHIVQQAGEAQEVQKNT